MALVALCLIDGASTAAVEVVQGWLPFAFGRSQFCWSHLQLSFKASKALNSAISLRIMARLASRYRAAGASAWRILVGLRPGIGPVAKMTQYAISQRDNQVIASSKM